MSRPHFPQPVIHFPAANFIKLPQAIEHCKNVLGTALEVDLDSIKHTVANIPTGQRPAIEVICPDEFLTGDRGITTPTLISLAYNEAGELCWVWPDFPLVLLAGSSYDPQVFADESKKVKVTLQHSESLSRTLGLDGVVGVVKRFLTTHMSVATSRLSWSIRADPDLKPSDDAILDLQFPEGMWLTPRDQWVISEIAGAHFNSRPGGLKVNLSLQ